MNCPCIKKVDDFLLLYSFRKRTKEANRWQTQGQIHRAKPWTKKLSTWVSSKPHAKLELFIQLTTDRDRARLTSVTTTLGDIPTQLRAELVPPRGTPRRPSTDHRRSPPRVTTDGEVPAARPPLNVDNLLDFLDRRVVNDGRSRAQVGQVVDRSCLGISRDGAGDWTGAKYVVDVFVCPAASKVNVFADGQQLLGATSEQERPRAGRKVGRLWALPARTGALAAADDFGFTHFLRNGDNTFVQD